LQNLRPKNTRDTIQTEAYPTVCCVVWLQVTMLCYGAPRVS